MSDTAVDPMIIDALTQTASATMAHQVVLTSGAGKAYQMVAQASALAVQDAVDSLRNVSTLADTATAAALARMLSTGDPAYATIVELAQSLKSDALKTFDATVASAAKALADFPSG